MFENVTKAPTDVHQRRAESTEGARHWGGGGSGWLVVRFAPWKIFMMSYLCDITATTDIALSPVLTFFEKNSALLRDSVRSIT